MNRHMVSPIRFLILGVLLTVPALPASAQKGNNIDFQYAADFVCGVNPAATERILPGEYSTTISIQNPNAVRVTLVAGVALSFPPGAPAPGPRSPNVEIELPGGSAVQIDCGEFTDGTFFSEPPGPPYIQGFVTIRSPLRLNVRAFHTVSPLGGDATSSTSVAIEARGVRNGLAID